MRFSSHYQFNYQLLLWYFTRNWRRERKKKQLEKEIRKYEDDDETIRRLRR